MRAVVIDAPGGRGVLNVRGRPVPVPMRGEVLIHVRAFGLNRSELHFRPGRSYPASFPRILGIETAAIVEPAPGGEFPVGARVMTMMGGRGQVADAQRDIEAGRTGGEGVVVL